MTAAADLRHLAIEAATCLICAGSGSCTEPDACRRAAGRYVDAANRLLDGGDLAVATVRFGEVTAFRVTDAGRIRVWLENGGTDLIDGSEISPW